MVLADDMLAASGFGIKRATLGSNNKSRLEAAMEL